MRAGSRAGLLVQPVDVLGHEHVEAAAALELDQGAVARRWARESHIGEVRRFCQDAPPQLGVGHVGLERRRLLGLGVLGPHPLRARGSPGCPSRSRCRRRSARRRGAPARAGRGPARRRRLRGRRQCVGRVVPWQAQCVARAGRTLPRCPGTPPPSSCCTPPTPRTASAGPPGRCWPGAARRGDRVAFALGSSADLICAVLGAARVGLIPVLLNATLTAGRARPPGRRRPTRSARLRPRPSWPALGRGRRPVELAPYPLTRPMHYTSGTTGRPKGVTTGHLGRGHGPRRLRGRGGGLALRPPRPAPGLLADVPHRLDPLLPAARCCRAGRSPS